MILPTTNLSIIDVRNAINYPSTDLGTLCSAGSPYVNMWAKYKPVIYPFTFNRPTDWWKSINGNCGITFTTYVSLLQAVNAITNNTASFTYSPPTGGETSPYRLGDFAGYDSNAFNPLRMNPLTSTVYQTETYVNVSIPATFLVSSSLTLYDVLSNFMQGDFYFGCSIRKLGSTGAGIYMTDDRAITESQSSGNISFPISLLTSLGQYEVFYFFTDVMKTNPNSANQSAKFVVIPNGKQTFTLQQSGLSILLQGFRVNNTNQVTVKLTNNFSYNVNLTNINLWYRYSDMDINSPFVQGEGRYSFNDISLNAGSVTTLTPPDNSYLPDFATRGGYMYFIANNGLYTETSSFFIMQPDV